MRHWFLHSGADLEDPEVIDSTVEVLPRQMIQVIKMLSSDRLLNSMLRESKLSTHKDGSKQSPHPVMHTQDSIQVYPKTFSVQTRLGQCYLRLKVIFHASEVPSHRHFIIETTDPDVYLTISSKSTRVSALVQLLPEPVTAKTSLQTVLKKFFQTRNTEGSQTGAQASKTSYLWTPLLNLTRRIEVPKTLVKEVNKCFDFGPDPADSILTVRWV